MEILLSFTLDPQHSQTHPQTQDDQAWSQEIISPVIDITTYVTVKLDVRWPRGAKEARTSKAPSQAASPSCMDKLSMLLGKPERGGVRDIRARSNQRMQRRSTRKVMCPGGSLDIPGDPRRPVHTPWGSLLNSWLL